MPDPIQPLWSSTSEPTLLASRDRETGEFVFPPVDTTSPLAERYDTVAIAPIGTIYSYTVIHPNPKSGEAPYALGYVDFPGPVRIFGRLGGRPRPTIGDRYAARQDDRLGYVFVATDR